MLPISRQGGESWRKQSEDRETEAERDDGQGLTSMGSRIADPIAVKAGKGDHDCEGLAFSPCVLCPSHRQAQDLCMGQGDLVDDATRLRSFLWNKRVFALGRRFLVFMTDLFFLSWCCLGYRYTTEGEPLNARARYRNTFFS